MNPKTVESKRRDSVLYRKRLLHSAQRSPKKKIERRRGKTSRRTYLADYTVLNGRKGMKK